ncbi:hypothetical protein BOFE_09320 (plasmid) [Candidatus Borrelia fainii]|uniref:Uncharacterized protein n=1 Tax=Candidatus Borrelia fainii TaxID=2518322 RepID=A0ABN6USN1_9SPIR|nr:hypothetical protein [Candidatus Borrelia fainii]BDU63392.1 hypothetical protein BOFE_09320 [Candidatus Borrelia fainii]
MLKVKYYNFLLVLILLLVINCNLKSPRDDAVEQHLSIEGNVKTQKDHDTKSLSVDLDKLLDTFGVSKTGKRSIVRIKDVVTNDKIGIDKRDKGYKTYTNLDFRDLLNKLGAARVQDIIKFDLKVVEAQKAALEAINNIQEPKKKQSLQVVYDDKLKDYPLHLKKLFSKSTADAVYANVINDKYVDEFPAIEAEARRIIANGDVYAKLSYKEKLVIDDIREIVTNNQIGIGEDYKTYTIPDFNALLNELGYFKVQEIVKAYSSVDKIKREVVDIINNLKDRQLKLELRYEYSLILNSYLLHLKSVFSRLPADDVYADVISDGYIDKFTEFKVRLDEL